MQERVENLSRQLRPLKAVERKGRVPEKGKALLHLLQRDFIRNFMRGVLRSHAALFLG